MKRSLLRMEGDPPYSPAVPDELPEAPPSSPAPPAPSSGQQVGLSRSLPAAEEVDVPAQIETRDRLEAEAPRPFNACLAGAAAAVVGAAAFGGVAGVAGCSYKTLVVGAGFLVTAAVRHFGKGTSSMFALIGAGWALVGCAAACVLATCLDLSERAGLPAMQYAQGSVGWGTVFERAFGPAELLWCAAAVVAAWMLSTRPAAPGSASL